MPASYAIEYELYPYQPVDDQQRQTPSHHPVVIVGGGPVGMALALDLGRKATPVLVLDEHVGVGEGSRAICFARRTLEIADRLGCAEPMLKKGVQWHRGRVFHADKEVYNFNLTPESGLQHPAFINLQQPYFERYLVEAIRQSQAAGSPIEIRGANQVTRLVQDGSSAALTINTPDGPYRLTADWVIACDGARSPLRKMLGLEFKGRVFEDNFLIADVRMTAPFPSERWFWFQPPFKHAGQSALLHKQPDNIWRIDFQLGWDIDRDKELDPDRIRTRIDAMLGPSVDYELVWTSIYTFQCRRMKQFQQGRVLFAGDSAHQVSPFGARGANSGIQDADNLGWKLDLVCKEVASSKLLYSYSEERIPAANENIAASSRSTDFLTPKSEISQIFRDAVLELAHHCPFARTLVNSGRLSVPSVYDKSTLNGPDELHEPLLTRVGAACIDAPITGSGSQPRYLLQCLGEQFVLLCLFTPAPAVLDTDPITVRIVTINTDEDLTGMIRSRYLGHHTQAVYLIRPDQHIAARWHRFNEPSLRNVLAGILQRGANNA